jgi:threonine dehydrogenase-like Zn-dependent dehydrogenase
VRALAIRDGRVALVERPDPEPGPGEALIRVSLAGICGTDLELLAGYKGFEGVPGHELIGVVERADGSPKLVGKRVVASINAGCGDCGTCARSGVEHCPDRRVLGIRGWDGAFAERVVVPTENLHVVPERVPDRLAVFAEPLAAACRIPEQVALDDTQRVVVVGAGRLGVLCALVLRRPGARVQAVARNPRVRMLLDAAGVPSVEDAWAVAPGADVVVDATGSRDGLEAALSLVRPRGTLVLKSTCEGSGAGALDPTSLVVDEITVVGSRCGPMDAALELLTSSSFDLAPMIDDVLPLTEGVHAFEMAARPGVLKILVDPTR